MALLGGIGGGITRDLLVNEVPAAITNPAYITLCLAAGILGYFLAFASGQLFREGLFQFMTAFSLPWYAIAGAQKGVEVGLPVMGVLLLAVVGPTAGRYYIDITQACRRSSSSAASGSSPSAVLTGIVWVACYWAGLNTWWSAGIAFVVGFTFRVARFVPRLGGTAGEGAGRRLPAQRREAVARPQAQGQVRPRTP